jgi:prolyl-tRNA synthetase
MLKKTAINPTREQDYPNWYQEVVKQADLAEHAPVRGCMVIKPYGFLLWENIKNILDKKIKDTGHENAYFPLFVPLSYLEKEAKHVDGFAKECAVVTHHRLEKKDGKLVPSENAKLEEPLIVRPTSEMIIGEMFSKWINSYRDLPLLINQWANVVRWEMRTRLFLRTTEFLWQEGHTAHQFKQEAIDEVFKMLNVYKNLLENYLAIPTVIGKKTKLEKFPGADDTYTLENMMQDGKALQSGTSHYLGQNFAKSSNIKFSNEKGELEYAYTTSWGVTTRLIGSLIMVHSDDNGLVIPPKIAPYQIVILPIIHDESLKDNVIKYVKNLQESLNNISYHNKNIEVKIDSRNLRGGEKKWLWIKKGVPLILEIGPKDIENSNIMFTRRDTLEKSVLSTDKFLKTLTTILDDMQNNLFEKANKFLQDNTHTLNDKDQFYKFFSKNKNKGFVKAYFCENEEEEEKIKKDLSVTVRCLDLDESKEDKCIFCSKKTKKLATFAKAY